MLMIFDACSIINLLIVDEDDFILGRLRKLDIRICQKVYSEVKENIRSKYSDDTFDSQLGELSKYTNIYNDFIRESENEITRCYEDNLLKCYSYGKKNGEFYSVLCCSLLSRSKKVKVFFYTDDYKAKNDFAIFFAQHQIGYIEDTADFLLFLAANDNSFQKIDLVRFMDNLRSNYNSDFMKLLNAMRKHYDSLSPKDKKVKDLVFDLIGALSKRDIESANKIKLKIYEKNNKDINQILKTYESVFQAQFSYLDKIDHLIRHFSKHDFFSIE